ncbi:hypothetical protein CONPUDRAFT_79282 [Coniophora puteana RWD-64-598 SS2]|uniref:Uncharacterized protein n=1 Tax=Coniophora puteana (strain RWD-64-598) TaxID=741705 RepID=A0A5M3N756_CONPW|nr:uncharacterized protein CONPUDRAFT_79282 [Coniophora puteana RWD-64-598 SS2]EIW87118.1 hypothetical protein CONPUDRAFT_79282 [Coniophora puteana RWD-64-598 SS2]
MSCIAGSRYRDFVTGRRISTEIHTSWSPKVKPRGFSGANVHGDYHIPYGIYEVNFSVRDWPKEPSNKHWINLLRRLSPPERKVAPRVLVGAARLWQKKIVEWPRVHCKHGAEPPGRGDAMLTSPLRSHVVREEQRNGRHSTQVIKSWYRSIWHGELGSARWKKQQFFPF